jgi:outer membrane receptor protein involved in Fe transport
MKTFSRRSVFAAVALFLCCCFVAVAGNGKVSGTVRDAENNSPVPGANVTLPGTALGAAADVEGRYFILNVPPGTYDVLASAVGYARTTIRDVRIGSDQILTLDFSLRPVAVGLEEILVEAERRIVDKSQTSSKTTLSSDDIGELPLRSAVGLVATAPSAFNGFIRGGKITESKTIIDGVDVSDQYYAYEADRYHTPYQKYNNVPRYVGSELARVGDLNLNAVEQLSVNTGAVGAEYSQATAGVINYSLKDGRGPIKASLFTRLSQFNGLKYAGPRVYWNEDIYFGEKTRLQRKVDSLRALRGGGAPASQYATLAADSARLGRYTYYSGKYTNEKPQTELEASLSGDIMKDWGVFITGKYFNSYGRLPNEFNREVSLTLKSVYNVASDIKVSAFGIVTDRGKLFGWKNRGYNEIARFFLEGTPKNDGADIIGSLKLTHVLSSASFYEIQASITSSQNRIGYLKGPTPGSVDTDPNASGDFITLETLDEGSQYISNTDLTKFFRNQDEPASATDYQFSAGNITARLARPAFYYENLKNQVLTVKGDYTNQITWNHRLQGGVQFRFTTLDMTRRASFLGALDARQQYYNEVWKVKPTEMGFYAQDRMEYAGLIINLGARVDTWNPDAEDFTNYFAPYLDTPVPVDTLPGVTTLVTERITQRSRKVDTYVFLSPRIGVSHPISDVAAMYFSYSRNSLPPPYSRMFASYNNYGNLSLPNNPSVRQKPYRSNNYELGVQWEFMPKFGLNFTAYLRDIENYGYTSFNVVPRSGPYGTNSYISFSAGYADARGVEISLIGQRQTFFDFLKVMGRVNYAYTYIKESVFAGLDKSMQTSFSTANGDSARLAGNLPFDDYQFYNKIERNVISSNSTLTGGYDRAHRITGQFILEFPEEITFSMVGTFQSGFYFPLTQVDARVAGRELGQGPWNKFVDIRLEKGFSFSGLRASVFLDVTNVFNWTNILAYDNTSTGATLWEQTNQQGTPDPTGTLRRPVGDDGTYFYGFPREYYFGVRIDL